MFLIRIAAGMVQAKASMMSINPSPILSNKDLVSQNPYQLGLSAWRNIMGETWTYPESAHVVKDILMNLSDEEFLIKAFPQLSLQDVQFILKRSTSAFSSMGTSRQIELDSVREDSCDAELLPSTTSQSGLPSFVRLMANLETHQLKNNSTEQNFESIKPSEEKDPTAAP